MKAHSSTCLSDHHVIIVCLHSSYFSSCACVLLSYLSLFGNVGMCLSMLTQQEKGDLGPKRDIDGMGVAEIKYGDSVCFIMHAATGLWLSYLAPDAKSSRLGPLKRRVKGQSFLPQLYSDILYSHTH